MPKLRDHKTVGVEERISLDLLNKRVYPSKPLSNTNINETSIQRFVSLLTSGFFLSLKNRIIEFNSSLRIQLLDTLKEGLNYEIDNMIKELMRL